MRPLRRVLEVAHKRKALCVAFGVDEARIPVHVGDRISPSTNKNVYENSRTPACGGNARCLCWLTSPQRRLGLGSPPWERTFSLALGKHRTSSRTL